MFIYRESRWNLKNLIFLLFCGVTLRKHYIIKATLSVIKNFAFSINFFLVIKTSTQNMTTSTQKLAIWQHFLISGKHRRTLFSYLYSVFQQFFNSPCIRVTSSSHKRKHHKSDQTWKNTKNLSFSKLEQNVYVYRLKD